MAEEIEGRVQEIEKSVETLESQMRAQIARTQSGARAILVIGIIIVAIIFIYMTWLTNRFSEYADPVELAGMVEAEVSGRIPEVMTNLETTLTKSAPDNVKYVLDDLLSKLPALRERAEEAVLQLVDQFGDQLDQKVDEIVAEMLEAKKTELDPLIEAAATKGDVVELEKAFRESLETMIGPKMDEVLREYYAHMTALERHLDRLMLPDSKLTPEEKLQKELITVILIFIDDAIKAQAAGAATPVAP